MHKGRIFAIVFKFIFTIVLANQLFAEDDTENMSDDAECLCVAGNSPVPVLNAPPNKLEHWKKRD